MVSASGVQETSAGTVVVGRKKRYEAKGPGAARWNMFERRKRHEAKGPGAARWSMFERRKRLR